MAKTLPKVLTDEELTTLLRAVPTRSATGRRNYAMLLCMAGNGLRCSEVAHLGVTDVTANNIHVWRGKGAVDRTFPLIGTRTWLAVQLWKTTRQKRGIRSRLLFPTIQRGHEGQPLAGAYLYQVVSRYGKRAGLQKHVHPHMLRHTALTNLILRGIPMPMVQRIAGHKNVSTTQVYVHVTNDDIREALERTGETKELSPEELGRLVLELQEQIADLQEKQNGLAPLAV